MHRLALSALLLAAASTLAAPAPLPKVKDDRTRLAKRQVLLAHMDRLGTSEGRSIYLRDSVHVFVCKVRATDENQLYTNWVIHGQGPDEIAALQDAIRQIEKVLANEDYRRR